MANRNWNNDEMQFALLIAEAAFRFAEKGNNLEATLAHIRQIGRPNEQERAEIETAIKQYHIDRGCCDGTFKEPCPFKETKKKEKKETAQLSKRELARLDWLAFKNAKLIVRDE